MALASTNFTVSFSPSERLGLKLVEHVETDEEGFRRLSFQSITELSYKLRQYPSTRVALVATKGGAGYSGRRVERIEKESIKFSGSNTASTEFPIEGNLRIEDIDYKFDTEGNRLTEPVTLSVSSDGQVVSSVSFFGVVLISYDTSYRMVTYTYYLNRTSSPPRLESGTVLAINKGEVAEFEIPFPEAEPEQDFTELYKVVSVSIINEEGEWERPPDWTGADDSPTWPEGDPDPSEPHVEKKRVHEIGYTDKKGNVRPRRQVIRAADPKTFDPTYKIEKELEIATDEELKDFGLSDSNIRKAKASIPDPDSL